MDDVEFIKEAVAKRILDMILHQLTDFGKECPNFL